MQDRPFPNHRDRKGKAQVMMVSAMDEEMISQPEIELGLDQMA